MKGAHLCRMSSLKIRVVPEVPGRYVPERYAYLSGTWKWLFFQNVIQVQPHGGKTPIVLYQEMWLQVFRHAGRRTNFRDKKSSDFSGEIFRERNYCPRTAFSGKKFARF